MAACDMLFLRATEPCSRGVFDPLSAARMAVGVRERQSALRRSWRRDGLTRFAQSLRVLLPASGSDQHGSPLTRPDHHRARCLAPLGAVLGGAMSRPLRDGREFMSSPTERSTDDASTVAHTNADVTLNVYTQVLDASLRTAVDRIGGELCTIVHESQTGSELNR